MDLSNLKFSDSRHIPILHPVTDEPTGILIEVASGDSKVCRDHEKARRQKRLAAVQKGKRFKVDADDLEDESLSLLVACTLSWQGIQEDGEAIPFTKENVRRVYEQHAWIRQQVDEAIADRSNFFDS